MDLIFKALNDPARRALLDSLRRQDGQSLGQLETQLDMSRFGVMKHLGVLEEAGLINTRREGRFKYHYLNALPLQEVVDRWIEPLIVGPTARGLLDLKTKLEGQMSKPDFVMSTFIRCTQDALWDALHDPDAVPHYHFMANRADFDDGAMSYYTPDGNRMLVARITEEEPKSRMETTFEPGWDDQIPASRVVYLIAVEGTNCRLTLEHYGLTFPVVPGEGVADGWERTLHGLKTWLETGQSVQFAQVEEA
ncbi:MAG: metalloregulator ArsR/SmtB family transcription factor [Pseudomonadota bacterium]